MRSDVPKVMHKVGGLPMLGHVLKAAGSAGASRVGVVVGPGRADVKAFVSDFSRDAAVYVQKERLGTAHAVLAARRSFKPVPDDVIVLYGDTPLVTEGTLKRMRRALAGKADVVVLGFRPADPGGYGRLLTDGKRLLAIREAKDASPEELAIDFVNAGVMAFRGSALSLLSKIGNANAKGEYYLTDLVELANAAGKTVVALEADADEVAGVNTRAELAAVESVFQQRARTTAMAAGVTLIDPDTVYFSHDTKLGRDVVVEPQVFFGPGVRIADGATVKAFSYLEGADIAGGAAVGPYARLRPGTDIGANARVGNFVEIKNATIDQGAKVSHLSYIGDAHIGAEANIGAGTITCNYDGFFKYHTEIGAGAFVGSNSALVAPVTVGDSAYVGSGSVITGDVEPDALAIGRSRQVDKDGWAKAFRKKMSARKKKR